jgi:quercetin dioxygenase-like cupin family protein
MSASGWTTARLDEIERSGNRSEWIPVRRRLGVSSFGVNAWSGDAGAEIIGSHEEVSTGHEELYLVFSGRAEFTVGGEKVDAAPGTIVFVRDPAIERGATATEDGTVIVTVGAKPGEPYEPQPWEINSEVFPLFDRGEFAQAKAMLEPAVAENPDAGGLLYNLACAESRLGETDAAIGHLARAVEIEPNFARYAQDDEDLEPIRSDPRFPPPPAS